MKLFLLGMLAMYLGTTIIITIVSACGLDEEEFLEIVFYFPLVIIGIIIRPFWNFIKFPRVCIFCLLIQCCIVLEEILYFLPK